VEGTTEILERNKGKGIDWNHRFQDLLSRYYASFYLRTVLEA
jgi:hypothetical protein